MLGPWILAAATVALGAAPPPKTVVDPFRNPLTPELIDQAATIDWVDGRQTSRADFLPPATKVHWKNQVTWFMAVPGGRVSTSGITFGASTHAGPRHLRVGFVSALPVGTVLTRG